MSQGWDSSPAAGKLCQDVPQSPMPPLVSYPTFKHLCHPTPRSKPARKPQNGLSHPSRPRTRVSEWWGGILSQGWDSSPAAGVVSQDVPQSSMPPLVSYPTFKLLCHPTPRSKPARKPQNGLSHPSRLRTRVQSGRVAYCPRGGIAVLRLANCARTSHKALCHPW